MAIDAVVATDPVFEGEYAASPHRFVPGLKSRLSIVRVNSRSPSVPLVFSLVLASQSSPARLLAQHLAVRTICPDDLPGGPHQRLVSLGAASCVIGVPDGAYFGEAVIVHLLGSLVTTRSLSS